MNILFLCGGLEPGRDGVGDYSRRIAAAGRARGWQTALLAVNDPHADRGTAAAPTSEGIPTLRLSNRELWATRAARAAEFIAAQAPEWVSVQFVGYALEPTGVVSPWIPRLAELGAGRRVHVMFHEIWIGASTEYGWRDRIIGAVQRRSIRALARQLRPAAAHTSNAMYAQLLAEIGVRAGRLPLPGNIPVLDAPAPLPGWPKKEPASRWVGTIFGTIHPRWSAEPWLAEMSAEAARTGRRLTLVQLGEAGEAGRARWAQIEAAYRDRVDFLTLGPRPPDEVSRAIAHSDFGVATSPWTLIEKSGATAAFLDHGVPVLVPRDDWQLRTGYTAQPAGDPLLFRSVTALLKALPLRGAPRDRATDVAVAMERELGAA